MPIYTGDKFGFGKSPDGGGGAGAGSGEAFFPEPGQYDWVCPEGVTKVCVVCIGGGGGATRDEMGGAGGGGLGYKNNISVTPGETYKIQVGAGGVGDVYMGNYGCRGGDSWFIDSTTVQGQGGGGTGCSADGSQDQAGYGGKGGVFTGDGGGNGGNGGDGNRSSISGTGNDTGGGGAGGYGGDGGRGGDSGNYLQNSGTSGNAGAGGGGCTNAGGGTEYWGGGGGGVSVYGKGRNGLTNSSHSYDWCSGGGGGSGGAAGWGNPSSTGGFAQVNGGQFGGGGGSTDQCGGYGGSGAVRIIWGTGRSFPSVGADDYWSETITRYTAPTAGDPTTTSSNWFRGGLGHSTGYSSQRNDNGIVPNVSAHDNLDGAFTWECWIYCERLSDNCGTFNNSWGGIIMSGRPFQTDNGTHFGSISLKSNGTQGTGPYRIYYHINGQNYMETDYIIPQCTWTHVAMTRNNNNEWWMWVDGKRATSTGWTGSNSTATLQAYSDRPVIGAWGYGGRMQVSSWFGNISNLRITKGAALYDDANTTYTIPTFPLTTSTGSVSSHSISLDGSGDYLDIGDTNDLDFGTDDFTVECWFNKQGSYTTYESVLGKYQASGDKGFWIGVHTNQKCTAGDNGNNFVTSTTTINTNQWYHVALVRSGTTVSLYLNGTLEGTHSTEPRDISNTADLWIGNLQYDSNRDFQGNISNVRLVKGQALYTSNFTPATEPLTTTSQGAIESNVKLLCCNKSTVTGSTVTPNTITAQGSPSASGVHPFSPGAVTTLCCGVDDDYEKDLVNARVWSGPNCMPSVLGPGAPTAEVVKKGYRIWGRHRGLGGGTQTGADGSPGDGGLLSTWKKSTGSFQTEQFSTHGGWSAGPTTADGVAIKVMPKGAYLTGDNATAKWNLKTISYGVPTSRPRNNSVGMGPFIENVHIIVVSGKDMDGTRVYDSQTFTLRLPSYNNTFSSYGTQFNESSTSCAFEIELPNGGATNLDMDTWYSVFIKGMEHPNSNSWNSSNGSPGSGEASFQYAEQPVSYSNNSGSYNEMRYAPTNDNDVVEVRLEQCTYGGSWATPTHGSFQPLGQYPFFGISMPINFMKDPLPVPGAAPAQEKVFHASCWNSQETYQWTVPAGVTSICVICVGGGGAGEAQHDGSSGGGGGLAYKNNIAVTPGSTVEVTVGAGGFCTSNGITDAPDGKDSYITVSGTQYAVAGGGRGADGNQGNEWLDNSQSFPNTNSDGGGHGGCGVHHSGCRQSGGGAGGYAGGGETTSGYAAGNYSVSNTNAAGQGGGGGGGYSQNGSSNYYSAGGGGTGIYGQGSDGAAGDISGSPSDWKSFCGKGGSTAHNTGLSGYSVASPQTTYWGTATGTSCPSGQSQYLREQYLANYQGSNHATPDGGFPGGGGGGSNSGSTAGWGGNGVVRIIWGTANGVTRAFPSTGVDKSDQYPGGSVETPAGTQRQY